MDFRDPMTGEPMQRTSIITDVALMNRIQMWKKWKYGCTGVDDADDDQDGLGKHNGIMFFALSAASSIEFKCPHDATPPACNGPPSRKRFAFRFSGRAA
jgi:hypothetical protein